MAAYERLRNDINKQEFLLEPDNFAALCKINAGGWIIFNALNIDILTPENSIDLFTDKKNFAALCKINAGNWAIYQTIKKRILTLENSKELFNDPDNYSALSKSFDPNDRNCLVYEAVSKGILTSGQMG